MGGRSVAILPHFTARLLIAVMPGARPLRHIYPSKQTKPTLNASVQAASLVEAWGIPYVDKFANIVVVIIEPLDLCVLLFALQLLL